MTETMVRIDAVRIPRHRAIHGSCIDLANSIRDEGLRHPIVLWRDNTLISGERRVFAHLLREIPRIQAIHVGTIEDAAKALIVDNQDPYLALPQKWSEVCRLWQTLRRLDEPANIKRLDENRRRGVELRKKTQAGERPPGRTRSRTDDYVLSVICEPFGVSSASAHRVEQIFRAATGLVPDLPDDRLELARTLMDELDAGSPVWPAFDRWRGVRPAPVARPKASAPVEPKAAGVQRAAWDKALPQLEGLISGLVELGPVNPGLTWEHVGPVHARLSVVRRELDRMIKNMKESAE